MMNSHASAFLCQIYYKASGLRALIWQRPKSLEDMPFDVIFALSFHLSVKDTSTLRAQSSALPGVWPIPRLRYAPMKQPVTDRSDHHLPVLSVSSTLLMNRRVNRSSSSHGRETRVYGIHMNRHYSSM
ncbi:hypothetical protein BDN71DRAFT_800629 [Pleurotus eryngii]|uniref:Uncharacterized protein n=1 Tax=Pleurotus eryngii TaxID=5323 RepID=A0A9P5ZXX3_PLEER|nr:hypothetical protein BDN71DRAFT_800629 [Pleurotus eryngii]